ncbi:MAG: hypothetical protein H6734_27650 [Alphaproteobacteria bacterium]|nr:hypothetical protein [Alphaproteobacteria bacterium]MCB9688118.1 hypothetical protein [Alphaproteobacteria bacterium]
MNPWDPHLVQLPPDPERLERVRRRAHRRLEGTERRVNPVELGLVVAFSVAMLAWGVLAVVPTTG